MTRHTCMATVWALAAALVLHLVLVQPNHPEALSWRTLILFPLELPALLFALLALGQSRAGVVFRIAIVAGLTTLFVLKAADFAMVMALSRDFNLIADFPLILSFYQLIVGALGAVAAVLAAVAAVLAILAVAGALWWACGVWARLPLPVPLAAAAGAATLGATAISIYDVGGRMDVWAAPVELPGTAFTARVGVERYLMMRDTLVDLRNFRAAARDDPFARQPGLLDLVDRDVIVVFVESYGRTSFDTPFYSDLHLQTLVAAEATLDARGLTMASTFLTSPTQGGQSWLTHASFANGIWVDTQTSYRALLGSGRQTLYHLAADTGFHTAAVMPQITLDWPESRTMGFDTILAADDLGYAGLAFNWVTMPDQFTFAAMDRRLRDPIDAPLFIQLATGSSHAPWVPVPELIDWSDLGDGTIFNPIVEAGDPPRVVWRDYDRVRAQYRLAVDYALQSVFAYAELHAADPPLMLIIGDHQAAGFIALDERPHIPMHVVGPAALVERIADEGFSPGLIPSDDTALRPVSDLRAHLLQALSATHLAETVE